MYLIFCTFICIVLYSSIHARTHIRSHMRRTDGEIWTAHNGILSELGILPILIIKLPYFVFISRASTNVDEKSPLNGMFLWLKSDWIFFQFKKNNEHDIYKII